MASRNLSWVNTPVLLEAIARYEQGNLPRSMRLWLQTVLELPDGHQDPLHRSH